MWEEPAEHRGVEKKQREPPGLHPPAVPSSRKYVINFLDSYTNGLRIRTNEKPRVTHRSHLKSGILEIVSSRAGAMGSLMAGWDTPVKDPKAARFQRNRSLTRVEIDAYWKSKKKTEEEHLQEISGLTKKNQEENICQGSGEKLQRSSSLPLTDRSESSLNNIFKTDAEKINKTNCWWTRSTWAFLNEPPVTAMEGPSYKYASQYHVANFDSSKAANNSGIRV